MWFLSYSKITSASLCKSIHDIVNHFTLISPFESGKCGKEGKKLLKIEYLEDKGSFLDEIKTIFHSFWRATKIDNACTSLTSGVEITLGHRTWPNVFATWLVINFPNFKLCSIIFVNKKIENYLFSFLYFKVIYQSSRNNKPEDVYLPRNIFNNHACALFWECNPSQMTRWKPGHWWYNNSPVRDWLLKTFNAHDLGIQNSQKKSNHVFNNGKYYSLFIYMRNNFYFQLHDNTKTLTTTILKAELGFLDGVHTEV